MKKELDRKQNYTPPELIKCGHKSEDYKQSHDAFLIEDNYISPYRGDGSRGDGLPLPSDSMNRHQKCRKCGIELIFKIDAFNQSLISNK